MICYTMRRQLAAGTKLQFYTLKDRPQWPRGLSPGFAAAGLLVLRVRIPLEGVDVCLL